MGSLVDVECIKIKRRMVLSNIRLVNIPTGLFVVEFGGTCVWLTNWKEGRTISMERWSEPRPWRVRTHSGERETQELTRYQGKNGSQWNDEGAWERRGRSEFPDRRK